MERLREQFMGLFGLESTLSPLGIGSFVLITWIVWRLRREGGSFLGFLAPRRIWTDRSVRIDLWLIGIGQVMGALGIAARFAATPAIAAWVVSVGPGPLTPGIALSPVLLTLLFFVTNDFARYWLHRIFHTSPVVWPLHAVHHSASVLTPLTAFRQHPLMHMIGPAFYSAVQGVLLGLLVGTLSPDMTFWEIAGASAIALLINGTITNFQHSHIWISFGPVLEHLFISPAQHQIHHSIEERHFNRNYGQTLAVWDWIFGTLYVIREREDVTFGLEGPADAPLMTQRIGPILVDPLRRLIWPR